MLRYSYLWTGWVTYLRGDLLDGAKGFMFFEIVFSLSEEGLGLWHYRKVVHISSFGNCFKEG